MQNKDFGNNKVSYDRIYNHSKLPIKSSSEGYPLLCLPCPWSSLVDKHDTTQGILTEGEGSVQLTSSLR
jgi:hypothetical protein